MKLHRNYTQDEIHFICNGLYTVITYVHKFSEQDVNQYFEDANHDGTEDQKCIDILLKILCDIEDSKYESYQESIQAWRESEASY